VVVFIINILNIGAGELEGDAPIGAHLYGPRSFAIASQWVQVEAGQGHVAWLKSHIDSAQEEPESARVLGLDPSGCSGEKEPF
jgi:hypothetical protein